MDCNQIKCDTQEWAQALENLVKHLEDKRVIMIRVTGEIGAEGCIAVWQSVEHLHPHLQRPAIIRLQSWLAGMAAGERADLEAIWNVVDLVW